MIPKVNDEETNMLGHLADAGCRHVIIEYYKSPADAEDTVITGFKNACRYDVVQFYMDRGAQWKGMDLEVPAPAKYHTITRWAEETQAHGMTFGAADNDLRYLGDSPCCCGVEGLRGFENWYRHQNSVAVMRALSQRSSISYSLISGEWYPTGNVDRYINSKCRLPPIEGRRGHSVKDYVVHMWNSSSGVHSPSEMLGVGTRGRRDGHGNLIYELTSDISLRR